MEVTFLDISDKEKFSFWQSFIYKAKTIFKVIGSRHYMFMDVQFSENFDDVDISAERYKLSYKGTAKLLKALGEEFENYDRHCESIKNFGKNEEA